MQISFKSESATLSSLLTKKTKLIEKRRKIDEQLAEVDREIRIASAEISRKPASPKPRRAPTDSSDFDQLDDEGLIKLASRSKPSNVALHNYLNARSKSMVKVFGYWRATPSKGKGTLPFPVAFPVKGYSWIKFKPKLSSWLKGARKTEYKGTALNRWSGRNAGATEYSRNGWRVPAGVIPYLSAGVPPTKEFYKEVTGRTLASLPDARSMSM